MGIRQALAAKILDRIIAEKGVGQIEPVDPLGIRMTEEGIDKLFHNTGSARMGRIVLLEHA